MKLSLQKTKTQTSQQAHNAYDPLEQVPQQKVQGDILGDISLYRE